MTNLSVNINKIATLRNARGENTPDLLKVAADCERFGAQGITVHPRPDERHIKRDDVYRLRPLIVEQLREAGIRSSIFVGTDADNIRRAAATGADRVELYTKPYADLYPADPEKAVAPFVEAADTAMRCGLGVNAGHDLSLENLEWFHRHIPRLSEVSIGHALICDALYLGLEETIRRYRQALS
ncbi:MAG: pyridoxine 5'-phosphate synthase [Muribaculaceae bacterium]|nr:pyridoxine 5'-phosphate synthase [Muribaculaceae bacterium]